MQRSQTTQAWLKRIQSREPAPDWSLFLALFFVLAYIVLWIAGQVIVITVNGSSVDGSMQLSPEWLLWGALLGCLVLMLGVIQWARRRFKTQWIDVLHLSQPRSQSLFVFVLVGLGAAWAIDLIGVLLKLKGVEIVPPVLAVLNQPIGITWVAGAIFAIVIQPIAEGLIFYGVLYAALSRDLNSNLLTAIVIAILYTLITAAILSSTAESWYLLIQPFLMAIVIILVRAYTQSTQAAIVARAMFGLFFVLAALISIHF